MRTIRRVGPLFAVVALGCGTTTSPPEEPPTGTITAALEVSSVLHDVTAVRFDVVAAEAGCDATPIASKTAGIETEPLPGSVEGGAGKHQFADGLFVLPPGSYQVCATPLGSGGGPSLDCARASAPATVVANETGEVVLISQCRASPNGGADVVVSLNDPPQITAVVIDPSKFITVCESARITATAADPNGDSLHYGWSIVSGPGGTLTGDGPSVTFSTRAAGDSQVKLTVDDGRGGVASISFPLHVSDAVCAVPAPVQAIIDTKCSPCHTTGASGGLSLANAETSFANLVDHSASAAACADRVRVVRGNAAASYLIAKLRNITPICGLQMPRMRPPLPEEEIQTIEAWINGLPR